MRPLRILVAHQVPRARVGGMSRIMGFMHDEIAGAGHLPEFFCSDDVPPSLNGKLARFTFPLLVRRKAIAAAKAGAPFDVINVHEPSASAISVLRRSAANPRIVVTTHGVERRAWEASLAEGKLNGGGPSLKTRVSHPLTSLWQSAMGLRHADHIFCLNEEDRQYLIERMNLSSTKITRIFPAANRVFASAASNRDYSGVRELLFAGSWIPRKGITDLVLAITRLFEKYPNLSLTVLGAGTPERSVQGQFPESIRDRVRSVRTESEAETAAAFAAADIYILPSLFEGTPLTLVEAMMSGLPIVTTNTCGMKDVVRSHENGVLIPLHSPSDMFASLERLIADRGYRERLGRTAQAEALQKYVWESVAVPVREVYEKLCR